MIYDPTPLNETSAPVGFLFQWQCSVLLVTDMNAPEGSAICLSFNSMYEDEDDFRSFLDINDVPEDLRDSVFTHTYITGPFPVKGIPNDSHIECLSIYPKNQDYYKKAAALMEKKIEGDEHAEKIHCHGKESCLILGDIHHPYRQIIPQDKTRWHGAICLDKNRGRYMKIPTSELNASA